MPGFIQILFDKYTIHSKKTFVLYSPSIIVHAQHLTKYYGSSCVVNDVSFQIQRGEFCGILGPNGAGKTTTLKMLSGHVPIYTGTLHVLGFRVPEGARTMREKIGIVPQADNLDPDFTVTENFLIYGGYFGLPRHVLYSRLPELLRIACLEDKAKARIHQLSGGMKRRLSIARALINNPELLILDEPTTGLDPQIRQSLWQFLRELQHRGLTIVLTTHYMDEAERLCDRIILMDKGEVLADEKPHTVIRQSIERHVVEVHGPTISLWLNTVSLDGAIRYEQVGESVFFYGEKLDTLVESLDQWGSLRYVYRPANLEDVFLKFTGRELRDG